MLFEEKGIEFKNISCLRLRVWNRRGKSIRRKFKNISCLRLSFQIKGTTSKLKI